MSAIHPEVFAVLDQIMSQSCQSSHCAICLEPLLWGDRLINVHEDKANRFAHIFHEPCLQPWVTHYTCPLCRELICFSMMTNDQLVGILDDIISKIHEIALRIGNVH